MSVILFITCLVHFNFLSQILGQNLQLSILMGLRIEEEMLEGAKIDARFLKACRNVIRATSLVSI